MHQLLPPVLLPRGLVIFPQGTEEPFLDAKIRQKRENKPRVPNQG